MLCVLINLVLPPMSPARVDEILLTWRIWTQPLAWLLMMLLAGWLLEAALSILRAWRAERVAA